MAITAAFVEANGWVLRLTLSGGPSSTSVAGFSNAYSTSDNAAQAAINFSAYDARLTGYARGWATAAPLTVVLTSAGYAVSGGKAVAATPARTLTGTKILRKAVDATPAGLRRGKEPDEHDNGDGTVTVRVALHQHVYAGETGLSLTALAGWRTGLSGQTIAVTNTSTVLAPAPIVRWTDAPYQLQQGNFWIECAAAAHHPSGVTPIAAVKFTVTDGVTSKTYWTTALTGSPLYSAPATGGGTRLPPRVYGVTVDPTGFVQGLLRCDWTAYPWIGPAQTSDPAGTQSMTGLGTVARATSAFVPFVVPYAPPSSFTAQIAGTTMTVGNFTGFPLAVGTQIAGTGVTLSTVITALGTGSGGNGTYTVSASQTVAAGTAMIGAWIIPRYIDIDETNGNPAGITIATTAAGAAAGTASPSLTQAISAMAAANVTVAVAAGVQAAITKSIDGLIATVRKPNAGTGCTGILNGNGTNAASSGVSTLACGVLVRGDPTDATQRACILRAAAAYGLIRISWLRISGLSIEAGPNGFTAPAYVTLDNFELRGASGQTTDTHYAFGGNPVMWVLGGKWWQHYTKLGPTANTPIVIRSLSMECAINAPVILGCARLSTTPGGTNGITSYGGFGDAGWGMERIAIGNDLRYLSGGANMGINSVEVTTAASPAAFRLGTAAPVTARAAFINNLGENFGSASLWFGVGENALATFSEVIVEGNTLVGNRVNNPYGTGIDATIALSDANAPVIRLFRFANNVTMKNASKSDRFNDGTIYGQRAGVALSTTRNKSYAVGTQVVIASSPVQVYQVAASTGNTATSGGPTGTASGQVDGGVTWNWVATELRQHGFRPAGAQQWPSHYGVGYEGNIDFQELNDTGYDPEFAFEFYGVGSTALSQDGVPVGTTADPFTDDRSGTSNALAMQAASPKTGGGNYLPLTTGGGTYILGRGRSASVDVGLTGTARTVPFAAGALELSGSVTIAPAPDRQASTAATPSFAWSATFGAAAGRLTMQASAGATGVAATGTGDASRLSTRAATAAAAWSGGVGPLAGQQAMRTGAATTGWGVLLVPAATGAGTLAGPAHVDWSSRLAVAAATAAQDATAGGASWQVGLGLDQDRLMLLTGAASVTVSLLPLAVADSRIALADTRLPSLLPPGAAPPERTLVVVADGRTLVIA